MRKWLLLAGVLATTVSVSPAQDEDSIQKIAEGYRKAGQADDRIDAKEMDEFAGRALALAKTKKGRVGFQAVVWVFYVCNVGEGTDKAKAGYRGPAWDLVLSKYSGSPGVADVVQYCQPRSKEQLGEFLGYLDELIAKTTNDEAKAVALAKKGEILRMKANAVGIDQEEKAEIQKIYQQLTTEYAKLSYRLDSADPKRTYGEAMKEVLVQLANEERLAIGNIAPEIEGEDLDGVAFKLSDYRGKVVMLDFYGHW